MRFGIFPLQFGRPHAVAIALLIVDPVDSAAAPPSDPFVLTWQAPERCPDRVELTRRVETFLGQSLEVRRAQQLEIDAVVQQDSTAGFVATLSVTTTEASYERRIDHQDCTRLTEAAALVIALAIDPERVRAQQTEVGLGNESETPVASSTAGSTATADAPSGAAADPLPIAPPVAAAAPPVPTSPAAPVTQEARPGTQPSAAAVAATPIRSEPVSFDVGVRGLLDGGTLPRASVGIGGVAGLGRGSFRLELTGSYWFPVSEPVPGHPPAEVEVRLIAGGVRGCYIWAQGFWDLGTCGGGELGDYRGRGVGLENPVTQHERWSAVIADLRLSRALTPMLSIMGGVEPGITIARPRVGVTLGEDTFEVVQPDRVFLRTYIGAKLVF